MQTSEAKLAGSAQLTTWLVIGFFLCILALWGAFAARVMLCAPEACFILATGRWIVQHGYLPAADPFSYNAVLSAGQQSLVLYQWLSMVIFFSVWKVSGAAGLSTFLVVLLVLSFVVFPLRMFQRSGLEAINAMGLVTLGLLAQSWHLQARPEVFSYFFLSFWLSVLVPIEQTGKLTSRDLALLSITMVVWCNLHSGFVIGIGLLMVFALNSLLVSVLRKGPFNAGYLWALLLCASATLINPYGINLLTYLPHLFFTPVNASITELQPISSFDFHEPTFYPFLALSLFAILVLFSSGKPNLTQSSLIVLAVASAFRYQRMSMFSTLLILGALSSCLGQSRSTFPIPELSEAMSRVYRPLKFSWALSFCLAGALGALLSIAPLRDQPLPLSIAAFKPPLRAIEFLSSLPEPGRLLNDANYGNVMMWHLQPCPPLFLYTHFDIFTLELVEQHWVMVSCQPGWRALLDKFAIQCIVLPRSAKLVQELRNDASWHTAHEDQQAAILLRIQSPTGHNLKK